VEKRRRVSRESRLEAIIQALGTHFPGASALQLAGQSYSVPELAQMLQDEIDAIEATRLVEAQRTSTIARERAFKERNEPILAALGNLVRGLYGANTSVLNAFALDAPKKPRKTIEVKVETAKKAKATRKVRRTIGKRQKKSAKG
jgi:hypothetical protein